MTNWNNSSRILAETPLSPLSKESPVPFVQLTVVLVKLIHVVSGIYIWEFVQSLDYEFSIMTGRRKFTRTSPLYIGGRWCTLILIIIRLLISDTSRVMSCQAAVTVPFVRYSHPLMLAGHLSFNWKHIKTLGTLSLLLASTLAILRAFALWEQKKVVIAIGSTLWLANATSYVYSISTLRGHQVDGVCLMVHSSRTSVLIISTSITDISILLLMLAGVLRWHKIRERGGILRLMYTQGLIWIAVFTLAGLPSVVVIILDLDINNPMSRMFLLPQGE
ncbi:hypothetical protein BC827DRAFT_1263032 [Russula dissimulans]|nr:hypothetical protein BC827DRAFT_1263032 [Russula dissimulans]